MEGSRLLPLQYLSASRHSFRHPNSGGSFPARALAQLAVSVVAKRDVCYDQHHNSANISRFELWHSTHALQTVWLHVRAVTAGTTQGAQAHVSGWQRYCGATSQSRG